ncbi:hypothetical protein GCM10025868_40710 [Angustibacter aerolatus]|uniref:tRNA (guanine-N(1)-)-methyltransferase n=1 Tax=Angustibacter aerolatus TaxID=1162965 RepID=A0ABQ6JQ72_9ACTN|nr:hypothetical protein GCM10025868_40710 [Angustibacter aerolatus]
MLDEAAARGRVTPVSLGDYVLNGGEVAALAVIEAVGRLLPGVVGNAESLVEESHEGGLLEYPVYTKPAVWRGRAVPDVLLSGHHGRIARWRRDERLARTLLRRPDLLDLLDPAEARPGRPRACCAPSRPVSARAGVRTTVPASDFRRTPRLWQTEPSRHDPAALPPQGGRTAARWRTVTSTRARG